MEAIQRAVQETLLEIALDTLDALKRVAFTTGRETQAIDVVRTKFKELLQPKDDIEKEEEEDDDLEKMIEEALVNA